VARVGWMNVAQVLQGRAKALSYQNPERTFTVDDAERIVSKLKELGVRGGPLCFELTKFYGQNYWDVLWKMLDPLNERSVVSRFPELVDVLESEIVRAWDSLPHEVRSPSRRVRSKRAQLILDLLGRKASGMSDK